MKDEAIRRWKLKDIQLVPNLSYNFVAFAKRLPSLTERGAVGEGESENRDETLLHGYFHHFNVLESTRGWLAIDPKGVVGPRGYKVGPFLINPLPDFLNRSSPLVQTQRRISILSEMLDMERERIRAWGFCHAVLSAW